jgi:Mg2+-importing ATPase
MRSDHLLVSKGAVEEMLAIATHVQEGDGVVSLDRAAASSCWPVPTRSTRTAFACWWSPPARSRRPRQGAVSHRRRARPGDPGFLTFLDPPKETAGPAIAALRDMGVR